MNMSLENPRKHTSYKITLVDQMSTRGPGTQGTFGMHPGSCKALRMVIHSRRFRMAIMLEIDGVTTLV